MRRRRTKDRIYIRGLRYYGDFRDFGDVGGKQEALILSGGTRATTDADEATQLVAARLRELKGFRKRGHYPEQVSEPSLEEYARYHLRAKASARRSSTVERDERSLSKILEFFTECLGLSNVRLSQITVERLTKYLQWRRVQPGRKGRAIAAQTLLHELYALSNLFKRAVAEGKAFENPTQRLIDKPKIERGEAVYLEPGEAARLLAAAKKIDALGGSRPTEAPLHPLLATHLYTGGRPGEVWGLEVRDIDLKNKVVIFRPNEWRRLKRSWSKRSVPLWPDLQNVLSEYIKGRIEGLLFPARDGNMIRDIRSRLGAATAMAKIDKDVTPNTFRHTFTASRLQTTDNGMPVSVWQVACELGHRDTKLIESTYGHLLKVRDRSTVVEYREAKVLPHRAARRA